MTPRCHPNTRRSLLHGAAFCAVASFVLLVAYAALSYEGRVIDYRPVGVTWLTRFPVAGAQGGTPDVPTHIRDMEGRGVGVDGFALGAPRERGLRKFTLVYNIVGAWGQPPPARERIECILPEGVAFVRRPNEHIEVKGVLHINTGRGAGLEEPLFAIDVDSIEGDGGTTIARRPRLKTAATGCAVSAAIAFAAACIGTAVAVRSVPPRGLCASGE